MSNSIFSPVASLDAAGGSFFSPLQGGYNPFDPNTGTRLYFSSRNSGYLWQASTGSGAVEVDGDPVGAIYDQIQGVRLSQSSDALRPTYKLFARNGNPILRFGGRSDSRCLRDLNAHLDANLSLTLIATLKNGEPGPPDPSYAADFVALGGFPDVEFQLYNSFVDPSNIKLQGSGTAYKNGVNTPLTLTSGEWFIAQLDVPPGFSQSAISLGANGVSSTNFFAAFDMMDILFIQPTPSANLLAKIYEWIRRPAGL